jgi:hypothetical protein
LRQLWRCFFEYRGGTVLLDKTSDGKGSGGTAISFVVRDGIWNQPGVLEAFEDVAKNLAPSVGGLPVQLHLLNSQLGVEKTSTVGRVDLDGNLSVYYEGAATQADALALGQAFRSIGFGAGADVYLTKRYGHTFMSFTVADGTWDNPEKVSNFERIVRSVATSVGGLPIEMQLTNRWHELKIRALVA